MVSCVLSPGKGLDDNSMEWILLECMDGKRNGLRQSLEGLESYSLALFECSTVIWERGP